LASETDERERLSTELETLRSMSGATESTHLEKISELETDLSQAKKLAHSCEDENAKLNSAIDDLNSRVAELTYRIDAQSSELLSTKENAKTEESKYLDQIGTLETEVAELRIVAADLAEKTNECKRLEAEIGAVKTASSSDTEAKAKEIETLSNELREAREAAKKLPALHDEVKLLTEKVSTLEVSIAKAD
jgi:chromosome segregation ATPase